MKQTQRLSSIVVALMAISHNRIDYPAGTTFEAPEADVVFLKMAKCVREPTADEIKAYEERQTLAQVEAAEPDDMDHAGLQPQPPSDSEPVAVEVVEAETIEVVEPDTVEPVEAVEAETAPESVTNPYQGWLKKDLNAELDKRGIEHDAAARNDDLELLLINNDNNQQADA